MIRLEYRIYALVLWITASGCTCGVSNDDGCGPSVSSRVKIVLTAPPGNAVTGQRQKFGFVVDDTEKKPHTLKAAVSADGKRWIACRYDPSPEATIDDGENQNSGDNRTVFSCPITAATLAHGHHTFEYSVDGDGIGTPTRRLTTFTHDAHAPVLSARIQAAPGGAAVGWKVTHEDDFDHVGLYVNGVRAMTSYEESGTVLIDPSIRRGGAVEMRAFDKHGNESSDGLILPE